MDSPDKMVSLDLMANQDIPDPMASQAQMVSPDPMANQAQMESSGTSTDVRNDTKAATASKMGKHQYLHCTAQDCKCKSQRMRSNNFKCSGPRQRCSWPHPCRLCDDNPGK